MHKFPLSHTWFYSKSGWLALARVLSVTDPTRPLAGFESSCYWNKTTAGRKNAEELAYLYLFLAHFVIEQQPKIGYEKQVHENNLHKPSMMFAQQESVNGTPTGEVLWGDSFHEYSSQTISW